MMFTAFGTPVRPAVQSITYMGQQNSASDSSSYTLTGFDFGAVAAGRVIAVGIYGRTGSALSITSVTIGGVTATLQGLQSHTSSGNTIWVAVYAALVPTGTSGSVVATFSASQARFGCGMWRLTGYRLEVSPATDGVATSSTGTYNRSVTATKDDSAVVIIGASHHTGGQSNTNLSNIAAYDWQQNVENVNHRYVGAHKPAVATGSTTFTVNWSDGGPISFVHGAMIGVLYTPVNWVI